MLSHLHCSLQGMYPSLCSLKSENLNGVSRDHIESQTTNTVVIKDGRCVKNRQDPWFFVDFRCFNKSVLRETHPLPKVDVVERSYSGEESDW